MNRRRGRWLLALAVPLVAASPARAATTANVSEVGTSFQPAQIVIALNDTVVWTNTSSVSHTVTFDSGPDLNEKCDPGTPVLLRTGCQTPGATEQRTFTATGTYAYHCRFHAGMTGVVVVASASSSTTGSSQSSSSTTTTRIATTTTTRSTSSTTSTTRQLATSSTLVKSTTTTADTSSAVLPGAPPSLGGEDGSNAASKKSTSGGGSDKGTVALIVGLLLVVSGGGGYLLWRLRPGRS